MQAIMIIELKIRVQSCFCIRYRLILLEIHLLVLHTSPEPFHENVVQCSSSAIPTNAHVCGLEPVRKFHTGKLRSLVVVENFRSRSLKCLFERFETKRCFQRDRSSPGGHIATEPVDDGYQVQKPSLQANVGNICASDLIDAMNAQPTQQIRIPHLLLSWLTQPRAGIDRHQAHLSQKPGNPLVVHLMALSAKPGRHLLDAIKRRSCILLVQQSHQQQVLLTFWDWLVIIAGACQVNQLALSCQTDGWMLGFNQRPLLFHPPNCLFFNQSISIFNCPIS